MDNELENPIKPTPSPPRPGGSVMDVQSPQSHQTTTAPIVDSKPSQPAPPPEPTGAPAFHAATPKPDVENMQTTIPPHHEETHEDDPHHLLAAHSQKRVIPIGVIIASMVVAAVLIGLAVFAYIRTKDTTHPNGDHQETTTTQEQGQATPEDVDETIKEVDTTLNQVDDTTDLSEASMTDQALGL